MRSSSSLPRVRRRTALLAAIAIAGPLALAPHTVSAEGLFDFFFGGAQRQQRQAPPQASFFADPFNNSPQAAPPPQPRAAIASSGPAFCVRTCDGRYFPLMRAAASPVQMCQSFCPASATKVFYGSNIDSATTVSGERYPDSENAFAYRKALRADCTCNGRDPAGLAPVDLALDSSLRPGDVIATTNGLVAYSGIRAGNDQTAEFTPVAAYPGLTPEVRTRLGEIKVAPVSADVPTSDMPASQANPGVTPMTTPAAKPVSRDKRADAD
ncbi:MAG: DUF2865 domain-containing protein [Bradyrhizobium sp.]|nr:DUF2865 domain-containing protein [Bradyrhizobium sp.]